MMIINVSKARQIIIVIILIMIIILSGVFSFYQYNHLQRKNQIATSRMNISGILNRNHSSLSVENVDMIDTWMTFDYINMIFKLPPEYLKNSLDIVDSHYPNLSLNKYLKNQKIDKSIFLNNVKSSVVNYFVHK